MIEARNAIRDDELHIAEQILLRSIDVTNAQHRYRSSINLLILLAQARWALKRKSAGAGGV